MKDVTQTTPGKGKPTTKNNPKESWFKRMKRSIKETLKETFGELRKVTWPSFGETMKQLGAVIAVVLLFLVVLTVFDLILGQGFQQFRQALGQLISLIFKKF